MSKNKKNLYNYLAGVLLIFSFNALSSIKVQNFQDYVEVSVHIIFYPFLALKNNGKLYGCDDIEYNSIGEKIKATWNGYYYDQKIKGTAKLDFSTNLINEKKPVSFKITWECQEVTQAILSSKLMQDSNIQFFEVNLTEKGTSQVDEVGYNQVTIFKKQMSSLGCKSEILDFSTSNVPSHEFGHLLGLTHKYNETAKDGFFDIMNACKENVRVTQETIDRLQLDKLNLSLYESTFFGNFYPEIPASHLSIKIPNDFQNITTIKIAPNPVQASSTLNITWEVLNDSNSKIFIYDEYKKMILDYGEYVSKSGTKNEISIALPSNLTAGIYVLVIQDNFLKEANLDSLIGPNYSAQTISGAKFIIF